MTHSAYLRKNLIRGGLGSLGLKLVSVGLGFLLTILLARGLGPSGYGVYALAFATISILAIPTQLGLPQLVVRETANAAAKEQWGVIRGLWRWSTLTVLLFSLIVLLVSSLGLWYYGHLLDKLYASTLAAALLLIPLIALGNLRGAALRGLNHIVTGQLPEWVLRPGLLATLCIITIMLRPDTEFTAITVMVLHVVSAAVAFGIGAWFLRHVRPKIIAGVTSIYASKAWAISTFRLALISSISVINAQVGILMLGFFGSENDIGIYKVTISVATLITFGLQAVNLVVMPYFARFYSQNDLLRVQKLATQSARAILLIAIPSTMVIILFGDRFLAFTYGTDFEEGHASLIVLAIGQLVNAATGSVGVLLNMTGHERDTLRGVSAAIVVNIVSALILIPTFSYFGAALSTAITLVIWNLVLRELVWRRIKIETMAFSMRKKKYK